MALHFDEGTSVRGILVKDLVSDLQKICEFLPISDPERLVEMGLARRDPIDHSLLMLTDDGNMLRSSRFGERVPLADAQAIFSDFMEAHLLPAAANLSGSGEICEVWLSGSLMRGEPTIGDADIVITEREAMFADLEDFPDMGGFISVAHDNSDLIFMPIPCRKISVRRDAGELSWEFCDEGPGFHPENETLLHDPAEIFSFSTDQGTYRSGTVTEDLLGETLSEAFEAAAENDGMITARLAATLARDMRSRYEGGANPDEPFATLWPEVSSWERPVSEPKPFPASEPCPQP